MKIYVGADHRGFEARQVVVNYLKDAGHEVADESDSQLNPDDDFPVFAQKVASHILGSKDSDTRGVLICGSGQGMCMAANRYKGIRALLGYDIESAKSARNDDDANVLCLPAELIEAGGHEPVLDAFLNTSFAAAPRFIRRIREMDDV